MNKKVNNKDIKQNKQTNIKLLINLQLMY